MNKNTEEFRKKIWDSCLKRIKSPNEKNKIWKIPDNNKLALVIIEFRSDEWFKYVLNNIANIYGGEDVSLYIIHGNQNETFIKDILKNWINVQYIKYDYDNINIDTYSKICNDSDLYRKFNTEFILIFQIDTITLKKFDESFYKYSYVGAPWTGYPNDYPDNPQVVVGNKLVGNGGYSLRNVKRMIEINEMYPNHKKLHEDVHITNCLENYELPDVNKASDFSVEWIYNKNPSGLHQSWRFHDVDKIIEWFSKII